MVINEKNKMTNEISQKKRRNAQHRRYEINNENAKIKKLFKKKDEEDEGERGRCTRCQIL